MDAIHIRTVSSGRARISARGSADQLGWGEGRVPHACQPDINPPVVSKVLESCCVKTCVTMEDLYSKILDASSGSKFFQFHAVLGKFLAKPYVGAPPQVWRPHLGEILDPPLVPPLLVQFSLLSCNFQKIWPNNRSPHCGLLLPCGNPGSSPVNF